MTPEMRQEYIDFFNSKEAGLYFLKEAERLLAENHRQAEDNPELSRDYMQRAKGNREVLDHIRSVLTEIKKGKKKRKLF